MLILEPSQRFVSLPIIALKTEKLQGILIPNQKEIGEIHVLNVGWILVIEKEVRYFPSASGSHIPNIAEATFRTLATNGYWKDSLAGKGILITV